MAGLGRFWGSGWMGGWGGSLMERFSERMGFKPAREAVQKDSMDDELRNRLWNALFDFYWSRFYKRGLEETLFFIFYDSLCDCYYKIPRDKAGADYKIIYNNIREYFFDCMWYEVYDFIEFVAAKYRPDARYDEFVNYSNKVLEEEHSAYRLVGGKFIQITSDEEISEIDEALQIPLKPVRDHLKQALELFADRENPSYRNSIKESISAVEAICKIATGDGNIRNALNKIRKDLGLHDNLTTAFRDLYSYTSAANGIRHCMTSDPDVGQEEAKFMLVTCSAFVNYLLIKESNAGIDLTATIPK